MLKKYYYCYPIGYKLEELINCKDQAKLTKLAFLCKNILSTDNEIFAACHSLLFILQQHRSQLHKILSYFCTFFIKTQHDINCNNIIH
jgi:hypothetical protein